MSDCPGLPNCGFMKKYTGTKNLACQGFMALFCRGAKQSECMRKQYKAAHGGTPPSDDMMPNGMMISA